MAAMGFDEFQRVKFFAALDGVRAVSVILVIVWHMPEKDLWGWLNGFAGVQAFFVLSGFLITTLCIREIAADGRLSLRGFYERRVHRILPLYALTLATYAILTRTDFIPSWIGFVEHLAYYLTLNGDLIKGPNPFQHSWTLGVEEKFYVVWPLLLVGLARIGSLARIAVMGAGLGVLAVLSAAGLNYPTNYLGIAFGCLLAFVLANRETFGIVRRWVASRLLVALTLTVTVALHLLLRRVDGLTLPYSILVGAGIACLLLRPNDRIGGWLSGPRAGWIGRRSYGIYLIHPILIQAGDRVVAPTGGVILAVLRLGAAIAASFAVADLLHRTVEVPMIKRGRRRSASV